MTLIAVLACSVNLAAQHTIWPSTAAPVVPDVGPNSAVELGVSFRADTNGYITGIRFYKSAANTGTHVGNLWSSTGTLLATATFTGETASGWQQVNLSNPVAITANTVYVASYHANVGHWSANWNYFASSGVDNAPLHAPLNGSGAPNGRFAYGSSSAFPTSTNSANYWVDVMFTSSLGIATTLLPQGMQSVAYSQSLSATGGTTPYTWSLPSGSLPPGLTLSSAGLISGTPTAAGTFSFTAHVTDSSGSQQTANTPLSINVSALRSCPCAIWPSTAVPAVPDVGPNSAVELGVSFRADTNGYITGIRFYKSAANTGTHVGNLWSSTGTLLATATFTGETASGWQQVNLSNPVAITANTVYVASYHANVGHWSANWNYFASSGVDNAPLHAPSNGSGAPNGRFAYGSSSAFPTSTNSANYWVDVVFATNAGAVAPSISTQPASATVTAGQTATFTVAATGTTPMTYQWRKNSGLITNATSSSYTTPATTSSDNGTQFSVVVSNAAASVTSNVATLTVNAAALHITTPQLPGGTLAGPYSASLTASGGLPPYTWSLLSGQLPNGLALNPSGLISGTPTLAGSFSFTVQVKDAAGGSASGTFSINIVQPQPSVTITSPAAGSTVSGTISVTGTASDTVALNSVQVSVDSGTFSSASGTSNWSFNLNTGPLSNGSHAITAKVSDAAGVSATSSPVAITVNNGTLATDCTLYASASGNDGNSGTSSSSPKTFPGAAAVTQPGSVVCLLGGTYNLSSTFYPPTSGTPSSWIIYKSYGDGDVNFIWTAGPIAQPMFKFGSGSFPSNPAYLEFRGLKLDGQNNALDGFFCYGSHHLRFIGNSINNTGGSGVGAVSCDYLTSDHNLINHNGYLYGWTSGISYNNVPWFDSYPGFHNIISNNIIAGEYDGSSNHTDGNGIILDLGSNTPPALIVNNVVYGNGGRCIQANSVTNFWFVNNTCYKNNLDTSLGNAGSLTAQNSSNGYFVNNITVAWHSNNPSYDQEGTNSNIGYRADMYFGSSINFAPSDPSQLIQADPLFVNAPYFDPPAAGQYATALAPTLLSNGLELQSNSPAYNRGIDPSTLSGLPSAIVTDLKTYIYTDINGKSRPQGSGSDLGAYQH